MRQQLPDRPIPAQHKVQFFRNNYVMGAFQREDFEGHTCVLWSEGGIAHAPDCRCHKKAEQPQSKF